MGKLSLQLSFIESYWDRGKKRSLIEPFQIAWKSSMGIEIIEKPFYQRHYQPHIFFQECSEFFQVHFLQRYGPPNRLHHFSKIYAVVWISELIRETFVCAAILPRNADRRLYLSSRYRAFSSLLSGYETLSWKIFGWKFNPGRFSHRIDSV